MALEETTNALAAYRPEVLTDENATVAAGFRSTQNKYTAEVERYLHEDALRESEAGVSLTTLFVNESDRSVGGFITVSVTAIPTTSPTNRVLQEVLRTSKPFIGAVMIDYVGLHDDVRARHLHLGSERILPWLKSEVVMLNRHAAAPLLRLDVRVGNWSAYRAYRRWWRFKALPVYGRDGRSHPAPAGDLTSAPDEFDSETYIKMYLDIYGSD